MMSYMVTVRIELLPYGFQNYFTFNSGSGQGGAVDLHFPTWGKVPHPPPSYLYLHH